MNSVIKGASYVLAHTPQMVVYNGTTQTTERVVNPESEYLKELESHLRSYEECVNYWPNQVYIGNAHPDELSQVEFPYYDKVKEGAERYGKYGEIMPEEEFILLAQTCDMFEVVKLGFGGQFLPHPSARFLASVPISNNCFPVFHSILANSPAVGCVIVNESLRIHVVLVVRYIFF